MSPKRDSWDAIMIGSGIHCETSMPAIALLPPRRPQDGYAYQFAAIVAPASIRLGGQIA